MAQHRRGATWHPSGAGLPSIPLHTLAAHPWERRLYAGTERGLFRSVDAGATWRAVLPTQRPVTAVAIGRTPRSTWPWAA